MLQAILRTAEQMDMGGGSKIEEEEEEEEEEENKQVELPTDA